MSSPNPHPERRGFLRRVLALSGLSAATLPAAQAQPGRAGQFDYLPKYARAQNYKSLWQSSYGLTGGNSDRWPIRPGGTQELFNAKGPGGAVPG